MTTQRPPSAGTAALDADRGRRRPGARLIELAPLVLVVVAEAAWIGVLGGLLQEFTLRRTVVGGPLLVAFVAAGVLAARILGGRLGDRWPPVAVAIALLAAALGWAISDEARDAATSGIGSGLAAHPGGLVAGLAVIRGYAHARLPLDEGTVSRLLSIGIPGLALVAVLGGVVGEPLRSAFLGEALASAIVFVAAAALALALIRLDDVGQDGGFDWRRNPRWLLLAVVVLLVAIAGAVPLAAVAGTLISVVISVALWPMLIVGLASGFDRTARRVFLLFGFMLAVIYLLSSMPLVTPPSTTPAGTAPTEATTTEGVIAASLGGLLVVAGLIGIVVLIALWMRRTSRIEPDVDETRSIDHGGAPLGRARRRGRFGRRTDPAGAAEAYVALIGDLDRDPELKRAPGETPAAHAARIRAAGSSSALSLDLLAADYALARYGGAQLTPAEDRRGIARWRRLRHALPRELRRRVGATAADAAVPAPAMDPAEGRRAGLRTS